MRFYKVMLAVILAVQIVATALMVEALIARLANQAAVTRIEQRMEALDERIDVIEKRMRTVGAWMGEATKRIGKLEKSVRQCRRQGFGASRT